MSAKRAMAAIRRGAMPGHATEERGRRGDKPRSVVGLTDAPDRRPASRPRSRPAHRDADGNLTKKVVPLPGCEAAEIDQP